MFEVSTVSPTVTRLVVMNRRATLDPAMPGVRTISFEARKLQSLAPAAPKEFPSAFRRCPPMPTAPD